MKATTNAHARFLEDFQADLKILDSTFMFLLNRIFIFHSFNNLLERKEKIRIKNTFSKKDPRISSDKLADNQRF